MKEFHPSILSKHLQKTYFHSDVLRPNVVSDETW